MTLKVLVASILSLINGIIPVLAALAVVLFFYGVVRFVYSNAGESKMHEKELIGWGIIALFVIFSLWGIIHTLCYAFLGDSKCSPVNVAPNAPSGTNSGSFLL